MATLEQLSAALVKADAAGNAADAKVFADEIRRMRGTAPKSLVDQIPDTPAPATAPAPRPGILDRLAGIPEASAAIGTGAITGLLAPIVGAGKTLLSGKYGTPEGVRIGAEAAGNVAGMAYQPHSQTGQAITNAVGEAFNALIPATPALNAMAPLVGPAARQAGNIVRSEADLAKQPVRPVAPDLAASRAAEPTVAAMGDLKDAHKLDMLKEAKDLGVVLHPSDVGNPAAPKATAAVAGTTGVRAVRAKNAELPTDAVRSDHPTLLPGDVLNTETFDRLRVEAAKPYEPVRAMQDFPNITEAKAQLETLRRDPQFGDSKSNAAVIDAAQADLEQGMKGVNETAGTRVVNGISDYRNDAKKVFNSPSSTPEQIRAAKLNLQLADVLETLIDANADPKMLPGLREARAKLAKIYADESVVDPKTLKVDPAKLAKLAAENPNYSGEAARLGHVIGQFPGAFGDPKFISTGIPLTIARIGGVTGALIHSASRAGDILVRNRMARNITSPEFQNKLMPPDRRGMLNQLNTQQAYGELPPSTPGVPVPYDWRNAMGSGVPNWTPGARPGPEITPEVPPVPPNRLASPSDSRTLEGAQARAASAAGRDRMWAEQQAAQQAAQEAATRRPAGSGQILEFDEAGRLRPEATRQPAGAIQVVSDTGTPLASAVQKMQSNQPFTLDAVEKIAWDRTKVDLATVSPEMGKLTDKQVLGKMMDREWVAKAVQKARDQAKGFDEIAARSTDQQLKARAAMRREQMLDLAESLEDNLRRVPAAKLGQGPKTRAFRNSMVTESQNRMLD